MPTIRETLDKLLRDLERTGDVVASAVVSRDGLLMSSAILGDIRAETFAAMSATMYGAAETAILELRKGTPERVIVEGKDAKLIVTGAGPKALLVAMTNPTVGLGLVLVNMSKAAEQVKELLK
ncbi:MAG: roadblock/LC7 domain-containing protein [Euryarchaeota archaeon]|nr:roadblock/LC7 domain-containing protein [Euryarchaeota archaeon]